MGAIPGNSEVLGPMLILLQIILLMILFMSATWCKTDRNFRAEQLLDDVISSHIVKRYRR